MKVIKQTNYELLVPERQSKKMVIRVNRSKGWKQDGEEVLRAITVKIYVLKSGVFLRRGGVLFPAQVLVWSGYVYLHSHHGCVGN